MEWLKPLQGRVVGLDTAPLIYFVEENPFFLPVVRPFFEGLDRGDFVAVTSSLTLTEVLTQPFRKGNGRLVESYRNILLDSANLITADVTPDIAERAARLRAERNLRTPDAIQIATAMAEGAVALLTNDSRLVPPPDLRILVLSELR